MSLTVDAPRFTTAHATALNTRHQDLATAVFKRWNEQLLPLYPPGSYATISPSHSIVTSTRKGAVAPVEPLQTWQEEVWLWAPHRSRVERDDPHGGKSLLIVNETGWAGWDPFRGFYEGLLPTNRRKRASEAIFNPQHAETALVLLQPRRFLHGYTWETLGDEIIAGRCALRLHGTPAYDARSVVDSGGDDAPALFEGADAAEFWIDAERSVLLRWAGLIDDEEYLATEITAIRFDEPLDDHLFDAAAAVAWVRDHRT